MGSVHVEITLVLLLEFLNSDWRPEYPRLNTTNLTAGYVRRSKTVQGVKNDLFNALKQYLKVNFDYCVQPTDQKILNSRKTLLNSSKCSLTLKRQNSNGYSDDDYTCDECEKKNKIIKQKKEELDQLRAKINELNGKLSDQIDTHQNSLNVKFSIPWKLLSIMSFISLIPHRTVVSLMNHLKNSCNNLKNIKVR